MIKWPDYEHTRINEPRVP